ncbi:MAG: hypothetical protein WC876_08935 [Candidatus Thermoplasmatota archaeon]|jgi:hypothetical protein
MRTLLVAAALLALTLAGCSGDAGGNDDGSNSSGGGTTEAPTPSVQEFPFAISVALGTPLVPISPADEVRIPFQVPEGHRLLEATATWACGLPVPCELELELRHGEQDLITGGFGSADVTMTVDDPPAGRWTFWAFPSDQVGLAVDLEGTLTIALS